MSHTALVFLLFGDSDPVTADCTTKIINKIILEKSQARTWRKRGASTAVSVYISL